MTAASSPSPEALSPQDVAAPVAISSLSQNATAVPNPGSSEASRAAAVGWATLGFRVFPLIPGTKKPLWEGWQTMASSDPDKVYGFWTTTAYGDPRAENFNIGYVTDDLIVFDIDTKKNPAALDIYRDELLGDFDTLEVETASGGRHLIYRNASRDAKTYANAEGLPIDIKGVGGLAVAPGSIFEGGSYRLVADRPVKEVPAHLKVRVEKARERHANPDVPLADLDSPLAIGQATRVAQAAAGVREGGRGSECIKLALQMRDFGVTVETAKEIIRAHWADRCDPPLPFYDGNGIEGVITSVEHAYQYAQNQIGVKSAENIFAGIRVQVPPDSPGMPPIPPTGTPVANVMPLATLSQGLPARPELAMLPRTISAAANVAVWSDLTESGTARSYVQLFKDLYRFDCTAGKGRWFDGHAWRADETNAALLIMREHARSVAYSGDAKPSDIIRLTKLNFAKAALGFAQVDGSIAVTSKIWNPDQDLLGVGGGGTVDTTTGVVSASKPDNYITRLTAVAPADLPDCPTWLKFIDDATGGDKALADFLQRAAGYSLTGHTVEHALFFLLGPGGNGKSVFANTLLNVVGDYGRTAAMDTLTASHSDKHPTDLAMLDGHRVVVATETEEGRAWAEARIKQMTGGDMITARFMRQDFFSYWPRFKLWIVGNHAPNLRSVDDAMRRRINIIPFIHKPVSPDPHLEAKLRSEWPGILRWMLDGCLMWRRDGLQRPQAVLEATGGYFESQDTYGQWAAECVIVDPDSRERPDALRNAFNAWAKRAGEPEVSRKTFKAWVDRQPHLKTATIGGRDFVKGIRLQGIGFSPVGAPILQPPPGLGGG